MSTAQTYILLFGILILLSPHNVFASDDVQKGSMKILAVTESSSGTKGSIADLSLEVRPGEGRVFLETFPPTKEDTQISMRFAKQVACAQLEMDCSSKDFIYTIRAGLGIVGGPSAGAAAAALTISVLSGTEINPAVAMTGTINSGGIVGPVGGLKSKIKAAAKSGIKIALIPYGTKMYRERLLVTVERSNQTSDDYVAEEEVCNELPDDTTSNESRIIEGIVRSPGSNQSEICRKGIVEEESDPDEADEELPIPKEEPVPLVIANFTIPKNATLNLTEKIVRDIDLIEFGKGVGIEVREVSTLNDALHVFTGKNFSQEEVSFKISPDYSRIMQNISDDICGRTNVLKVELDSRSNLSMLSEKDNSSDNKNNQGSINQTKTGRFLLSSDALRLMEISANSTSKGDYYSAASYCFRANIALNTLILSAKNLSQIEVDEMSEDFGRQVAALRAQVHSRGMGTITHLQAAMIVLERLDEAQKLLDNLDRTKAGTEPAVLLAYVQERLVSAKAWMRFFEANGVSYGVSEQSLKQSCQDKITEAEERFQYVNYYIPNSLPGVQKSVENAAALALDGSYQRCLHIASLAKAEADLISSVIGANQKLLPALLDQKLAVVKNSIARTQSRGNFPILAYSYYEYANSLRDADMGSALLFAEYAIELSNLGMYFEPADKTQTGSDLLTGSAIFSNASLKQGSSSSARLFIAGFLLGILMMLVIAVLSKTPRADARP